MPWAGCKLPLRWSFSEPRESKIIAKIGIKELYTGIKIKKTFKTFAQFREKSYLCTVQWNEGLAKSSSFLYKQTVRMITKETLKTLVEEWLQQKEGYFLVDIEMGDDDRIVIEVDHADGVWIEDCAELSRFLGERIGDDLGDYELEVGSAGLGQPFKVEQQYINHVGDDVEVVTADGKKLTGVLKSVNGRQFTVTTQEKQVPEGKKRPVKVDVDREFSMDEVQSTKYLLNFK